MEYLLVGGLKTLKLDLIFTLAIAALFLFIGQALQKRIRFLSRSNIPAPAIGGLLFAFLVLLLRWRGLGVQPDVSLRSPLQIAFFTTVGLNATLSLLRAGGGRLVLFWIIVSITGIVQNLVGIGVARAVGVPDAVGIICGAVTLTGGPATGLAFTDTFERMGIVGAGSLMMASATFGIIIASLIGGNPVATFLIRKYRLEPSEQSLTSEAEDGQSAANPSEHATRDPLIPHWGHRLTQPARAFPSDRRWIALRDVANADGRHTSGIHRADHRSRRSFATSMIDMVGFASISTR